MITINLRPGARRQGQRQAFGSLVDGFKGLGSRIKDPLLLAAIAVWVLVVGGLVGLWAVNARRLSTLEPRLAEVKAENRRFKTLLAQRRKEEAARDSILAQIQVIRGVDGSRYTWAHVMEEVHRALPEFTWLTEMSYVPTVPSDTAEAPPVTIQIKGRTMDVQAYTRFLRRLEASPWLADVTPVSIEQVVEKERPVTAFTLRTTFTQADSQFIRVAPLRQSLR
ncbi:MAG: PilN domain-containing protein [Gemmatimonadota bacterium]